MPDITAAPPRAIAGIAGFRDQDRLHAALHAELGAPIPGRAGFVQAGQITLARLAPARFLATAAAGTSLPARLAAALHGVAAVTDQSDMWATWQLSGAHVRDCLARIVPIDMAPDVFQVGDLALTRAGHLDVRLCRVAVDTYEIAVSRSLNEDLKHLLDTAKEGLLF